MTHAEMIRRLKAGSQEDRLSIYRDAVAGCSAYAAAGWDRRGLKLANAVFEWMALYGKNTPPTDAALASC
jgi:hypothetical protein